MTYWRLRRQAISAALNADTDSFTTRWRIQSSRLDGEVDRHEHRALVKFTVEDAKSLEDVIREAEAEARAMVWDGSARPVFHPALSERIHGEFTYEVPIPVDVDR